MLGHALWMIKNYEILGRKIVMGIAADTLDKEIDNAKMAIDNGAHAVMARVPNATKTLHVLNHFERLNKIGKIMVYNSDPEIRNTSMDEYSYLFQFDNVVAVKETNVHQMKDLIGLRNDNKLKHRIAVLSGDDTEAFKAMHYGADGMASWMANVFPYFVANFKKFSYQPTIMSDFKQVSNESLYGVFPQSVKQMVHQSGAISNPDVRGEGKMPETITDYFQKMQRHNGLLSKLK